MSGQRSEVCVQSPSKEPQAPAGLAFDSCAPQRGYQLSSLRPSHVREGSFCLPQSPQANTYGESHCPSNGLAESKPMAKDLKVWEERQKWSREGLK
ncbi:hypothetical protein Ddc_15424 [Ditylenchus destructor]|nr:hypothetical protein Ddc_15424 [Ditylenchus destructor]